MPSPGGSCMNRRLHAKSWRKLYEQEAACHPGGSCMNRRLHAILEEVV